LPDTSHTAADVDFEPICRCPEGTQYQSRIKPIIPTPYPPQNPPPRLETCASCPAGTYSLGNDLDPCSSCEGLDWGYYCAQGKKIKCPKAPGIACVDGNLFPTLKLLDDIPTAPIEMRESELQANTNQFTYSLSLSSQPSSTVTVNVGAIRSGGDVACINQPDRFQLVTSTLVFSNLNFREPQTVAALVQVNDTYQGPLGITFSHRVVGDGFDWVGLPVSLTILDDDACPFGAAQRQDKTHNARVCQCGEGYFVETRDASYCGSVTSCVPCPPGKTVCTGEESLEEMLLLPGKYRTSRDSTTVVDCPIPAACTGTLNNLNSADAQKLQEKINDDGAQEQFAKAFLDMMTARNHSSTGSLSNWGDSLCTSGHQGAFCQVCTVEATVAFYWSGQSCKKCKGEGRNAVIVFALAGGGIVVFGVLHLFGLTDKLRKNAVEKFTNAFPRKMDKLQALKNRIEDGSLQTKYKILVSFVQVLNKVATLYPISLPPVFYTAWDLLNSWNPLVLDLNVLPLNCIVESNFHSRLVGMTVAPILCITILFAYYCLRLAAMTNSSQEDRDGWMATCIRIAILFVLTIFPPVSSTIFQTFHYDERLADGSAYLRADYTIEWQDANHQTYRTYAILMGLLYCLLVPLCSFLALLVKKEKIQELQVIEHSRTIVDELVADETRILETLHAGKGITAKPDVATNIGEELADATRIDDAVDLDNERKQDAKEETARDRALRRMERRKNELLRGDPVLSGLSPLFADYEAKSWWWQILTFVVTLLLCGPFLLLSAGRASKVFLQMAISAAMMVALANVNPYLHPSNDVLAQMCQAALTLTMSVGLLEMAAESFQDEHFGALLVVCTTVQFAVGFLAGFEWLLAHLLSFLRKVGGLIGFSQSTSVSRVIAPRRLKHSFLRKTTIRAVAPTPKDEGASVLSEESRDPEGVLCVGNEEVRPEQNIAITTPAATVRGPPSLRVVDFD